MTKACSQYVLNKYLSYPEVTLLINNQDCKQSTLRIPIVILSGSPAGLNLQHNYPVTL